MLAFHDFESFMRMGGYSHYVWPAFAIACALLFSNYLFTRSQFRRARKALKQQEENRADETAS